MSLNNAQVFERWQDHGQDLVLTKVEDNGDFFSLLSDHSGFTLGKDHGVVPKVGDKVTLYTYQFSLIRGMDLNGEPIYYKTDAELEAERIESSEKTRIRREEEFAKNKEKMDADYEALPDVFKRRIDTFRSHNPDFRQEYEAYEMASCIDAVKIGNWALNKKNPGESIKSFSKKSPSQQKATIPDLAYDQHSGNTFGFAVRLAWLYVTHPESVFLEHGAMTPLVGCKEYGCVHPRGEE